LSGQVTDQEIGVIASVLPPAEACHLLVDLANLRGGPDNVTVLIVRVKEQSQQGKPSARKGRPWYRWLPWPVASLIVGLLLVSLAFLLTAYELRMFGMAAFVLAAVAIIAGMIGLGISIGREKQRLAQEPVPARLRMYRQASCVVEQPLLDKLTSATAALEQQTKERQWAVDWMEYQEHSAQGNKLLGEHKLTDAFREYCRAMRILAETLHRQRAKGEDFRPLWDK